MTYAIMCMVRAPLPCLLCVFFLAARPAIIRGQQQKYEGLPITNISFEPAEQPLDASELHEILPLQMNRPLHIADVRASIDRLFATGRYADIQVAAQPYRNGVAIRFVTRNSWFVGSIFIGGRISSPPNRGQLENATRLDLGQPYSESKLRDAQAGVARLLDANGLYRSNVTPSLEWDNAYQQVHIRFDIQTGHRAHFTTPVLLGELKMDPQRVAAATKFRRWLIHTWKPVTQTRVRQGVEGVRSLYEKAQRLEAKVTLESIKHDVDTNTAIPTLEIDAGPRIQVRTVGASVPERKLKRYIPIFQEHAVDHDLLVEGARNLRDYFQSQGYFDADVQFKQQQVSNDQASIDFQVNPGKRHKVVVLEVEGNHYFTTATIRERMFLRRASLLQFPHGRYSENLVRRDEDTITSLYQANGFRDVEVTHRIVDDYKGNAGDLAVFLMIKEGPQYFIERLEVDGIEHLDRAAIMGKLSSVEGQPFSDFNVAVDRDTILAQCFRSGFRNATFEWSSKPAARPHHVDLRFVIVEGPQQFVRQVVPIGLEVTSPSLVYRRINLKPGDPLSPAAVTDIQRRLYDLGVFARVNAAVQDPDGETEHKYVLYDMDEARRYSLATGVGAELGRIGGCQTCLEAPAGATGFSPRVSVDLTRNNLWGLAQSLSLRTRVSTLDQRALLNYGWPHFRGHDNLTVNITGLYERSRDVRTFTYRREEGSVQLSQRVGKAITLFYRYAYRRVSVGDLKVTPFLIPQLSQPVRVGIASINMVQDRRDDPVDPRKGFYNTVDLGLASHAFGSQVSFARLLVRNATYHPLTKRLVFARSTELGDIRPFHYTGDPAQAIPLPERFYGGGGSTNRGFPELQAGPRDISTGFPLGGNALLFNQSELRFPLIGENIGGVLFHDMGNVYSTLSNISFRVNQRDLEDFDYMVHAVGFGIRYRTPVGPLRLDLAYSINPPRFFGFKGTQQDLVNAGVTPCSPPPGVPNLCVEQQVSHFQFFFSIGQTF